MAFVRNSINWTDDTSMFPTKSINSPMYQVSLDADYVNCSRFTYCYDDMIFSQIDDYGIVMWQMQSNEKPHIMKKLPVPESGPPCKFSHDFGNKVAMGNKKGQIYVWDCQNSRSKTPVIQTAMSLDGS
ncbi:unnamed protein product [Arabis nemorensis]|uniref:Uncharacterized protein n=1 Tax=Arabis nemorensis TaxID=586526 RepID=A0A565BHE7_9BRAS|nr:unnamed protein product [Arabis nemorensis]